MFLSRLGWIAAPLFLVALPAFAADPPRPLDLTRDGHGRPMIRTGCGDVVTDERLALLAAYPEVEVVWLLGRSELTDDGLVPLARLGKLRELMLSGTAITENGLRHLRGHPALRVLLLFQVPLTRSGAEQLASIPHLETLRLRNQHLDPGAFPVLAGSASLRRLAVDNSELSDEDLASLRQFSHIESLELRGARLTDASLASISGNTALRELSLTDFSLTPAGAADIAGLPMLERLALDRTAITPAAFDVLQSSPRLKTLRVSGPHTDADLAPLAKFNRLRQIDLQSTQITQKGTSALRASLPNTVVSPFGFRHTVADIRAMSKEVELDADGHLTTVNLSCTKFATDEKLNVLPQFPTITKLRAFGGAAVTDEGLHHLTSLPRLQFLELKSSAVSDAGLKHLAAVKTLRTLRLDAPNVTDAGLAELRKALPDADVSR